MNYAARNVEWPQVNCGAGETHTPSTAEETLHRCADIADQALVDFHRQGYVDRINTMLDALHLISQERIEWVNRG